MSDPNNNSSSGVGVAEEIIQKFLIKSMEERSLSVLNGIINKIGQEAYKAAKPELEDWATKFGAQREYEEYARYFSESAKNASGRSKQIKQRFAEEVGKVAQQAAQRASEAGGKVIQKIEGSIPSISSKVGSAIGEATIGTAGNVFEGAQKIENAIHEAESNNTPPEQVASELAGIVIGSGVVAAAEINYAAGLMGGLSLLMKVRKLTVAGVLLGLSWDFGWWIGTKISDFFRAKNWRWPSDPIILDLDGDGLETVGLAANIHFDHDGDGVLTKTGWAGKDDALLVWDRNANGAIDTGAELFGDFTVLPNGTLAPNGFAALAALDSNGDGILDASDPAFAELKLWRDSSQDGVSQGGEFITLAEAGIVSLNLANTLKNQNLANGNQLSREGSFTRFNGTTGSMGEFKLATDTSSTQFAEQIEVPEVLKSLPNLSGSGNVR